MRPIQAVVGGINNAIGLIDYINLLRSRGQPLGEAIENADRSRLRPVLITTLGSVAGMLPMVFGGGEGADMWKPMGATVTLVLVPTLYSLAHSRGERKRLAALNPAPQEPCP